MQSFPRLFETGLTAEFMTQLWPKLRRREAQERYAKACARGEVMLKQVQWLWGTTTAGKTILAGVTARLTQAGHGCGERVSFPLMLPQGHTRVPGWLV